MVNILVDILHNDAMLVLYFLFGIAVHPISLGTPFVLAYIFSRRKRIYFKILLFFGAFLLINIALFWLYSEDVPQRFLIYALGCFFMYYIIVMSIFLQKLKTTFFKILSIIVVTLIFSSLTIFYIEENKIAEESLSEGAWRRMDTLRKKLQEYAVAHNGYYPTYDEYYDEISKSISPQERYYLTCDGYHEVMSKIDSIKHGTPTTTEFRYELTQKKYTTKDNPNLMIAWYKKNHGFIFKWRYIIFVGKGELDIKAISEGRFQKLLREQQESVKSK